MSARAWRRRRNKHRVTRMACRRLGRVAHMTGERAHHWRRITRRALIKRRPDEWAEW